MCDHRWVLVNGGIQEFCVDCEALRRVGKGTMSITDFIRSIIEALERLIAFLAGFTIKGA